MRVLMISLDRGFLGESSSGDVIARHQKYADQAGFLDVIVFGSKKTGSTSLSGNFRVFSMGPKKFIYFNRAADLGMRLQKEIPYDLLVTQDFAAPAGQTLKKKLGTKWVVNIHSMFFSAEWLKLDPIKWFLLWRIKRALCFADGFRVNNEAIKQKLLAWGCQKPILIQATPVDTRKFQIANKPNNPVPQVLFIGRLSSEKNLSMLIKALKNLKSNFLLKVVGEGPEEKRLKKLAGLDKRMSFFGGKSHEELIPFYQQADIFVLPSNTESYGKVLIEAAAAGCALVASRTTGASGIIDNNQNGILVDVGSQRQLQQALERVITDTKLRQFLGQAAQKLARHYDADQALAKTIEFWKLITLS